ncbi:methionine synthase [Kineosporia sp. R_H_3]|uniref:methionine synthase n=1 Tax=Kineosporia sp. R_H_3 TaxID=1961848 RepID=UPI0018EA2474|nr:methionine synthase [Kineosporia sp. R_H_3]
MLDAVPGRATGIGSWPGGDVLDTMRTTFGELGEPPHLPYLPELPGRGPGSEIIGRGAVLLVDMPVDLQPSGWRLVDHPGRDLSRAQGYLREDLDVLAEVADGYVGPLKVQVAGPWTLAASLHLQRLERAVVDPGAARDITASLAEGVARHVAEVRRLVPGADVVVQVDEPSLPAVLLGRLPTASGFGRLRAVEESTAVEALDVVLAAAVGAGATATALHCCADDVPLAVLVRTAADALAIDLPRLGLAGWEVLGEAVDHGTALWAGVVGAGADLTAPASSAGALADVVWTRWRRIGLGAEHAASVVLTPACGLAGTTPAAARATIARLRDAAAALAERAAAD